MADYTTRTFENIEVALPASAAENEHTNEAVQALLQAAWPRYNASLKALGSGHIPEALREAEAAFHVAPYSVMITEYGLALAIQHGDFERADRLLAWSLETGIGDSWPDYNAALDDAVRRWNLFVDDSEALRAAYQSSDVTPSYRELLLLAHHAGASEAASLTDAERAHLHSFHISVPEASSSAFSPAGSSSSRDGFPLKTSVLSGALGLLLGAGIIFALPNAGPISAGDAADISTTDTTRASESLADGSDTSASMQRSVRQLAQINLDLAQDRPIEADDRYKELLNAEAAIQDILPDIRTATDEALFAHGLTAYQEEDYSTAFDALQRIQNKAGGQPQDRWYYQGMAAYELGHESQAVEAFTNLQEHLTDAYPHFDAQAAFMLVRLLPNEEARPYAERIVSQYSDTIYNNSVVQAILDEA